jgi:hypothetical protein
MDTTNKLKGPSPHYSLYQREVFEKGGTKGICEHLQCARSGILLNSDLIWLAIVPSFSVHPDELGESTKKKLNDRGYFYANSNAGLGWTDRANR